MEVWSEMGEAIETLSFTRDEFCEVALPAACYESPLGSGSFLQSFLQMEYLLLAL